LSRPWVAASHPERGHLAIVDLQKKLEESSVERREAEEKLGKLQADLDQKLAALRGREGELVRLQGELEEVTESKRKSSELGQKNSEL